MSNEYMYYNLNFKIIILNWPDTITKMKQNPCVIVRMRPLLKFQDQPAWIISKNTIKCMHSKAVKAKINKSNLSNEVDLQNFQYAFDKVVQAISSEKIYKSQIRKLIDSALSQYKNCTIVAYGQTCSGKTYTLLGVKQAPGFIPCIFRDIFNHSKPGQHLVFKISYIQIYNQKLIDLLSPENKDLKIIKDNKWGNEVQGSIQASVTSFQDCLQILDKGQNNRKYGEKTNHDRSSRSHTILKIYIQKWNNEMKSFHSVINVIDLAGSERLIAGQNSNKETGHINKSLFQFSNVIAKLSEDRDQYIPYRDSKLTRLLQYSLTKNSYLAIIFCISPAVLNFGESVSTLRLALKAKKVQIQNPINLSPQNPQIKRLYQVINSQQSQIKKLKQKITKLTNQLQYYKQLQKKITKSQKQKQKPIKNKTQIKALILLDHQNFMLSINNSVIDIKSQQIQQAKVAFIQNIGNFYEQYIKKIVSIGLNEGYDPSWLKIQDICFSNLQYNKDILLQYKIPILKQAYHEIINNQPQYSSILLNYIQKIQSKLLFQQQKNIHQNQDTKYKSKTIKNSSKYLNQSPIFQQSTVQVRQSQLVFGKQLLAWGCKKDSRVFKGEGQSNENIVEYTGVGNLVNIECGAHHTLVLNQKGEVFGWGKNEYRQVNSSKMSNISVPKIIPLNIIITSIAAGWAHSLLLSNEGYVYSFGYGEDGQLGHGKQNNICQPKKIEFPVCVKQIYAGHSHSGFIDYQENYYAFGYNKDYRLMVYNQKQINIPKKINLKGVVKAALGVTHSCLLTKQGKIYCGGVGTNGELGVQLNPTIPGYQTISVPQKNLQTNPIQKICPIVQVQAFSSQKILSISCGECFTAVITDKQQLYTFGKASFDRLGHNNQSKIVKILQKVNKVKTGYRHGFAWNQKNQIYAWGFNMYNQLGSLQVKDIKAPQLIHPLSTKQIIKVSTGFFHSAAIVK